MYLDLAIPKKGAAILRSLQPFNTTPQQYVVDLVLNACEDADVYNDSIPNDVIIEAEDAPIRLSLRNY